MMSSKNNGFTTSDIERYHSGKMTPEERHALEKAALDDPFLADALEGYAFTSTATEDIAKIQSRLNENTKRKKVVPLFQKYKWLSAAAILVIIAGAGWFAYNISQKENNNQITALEKKLPGKDSNSIAPVQNNVPDSVNDKITAATQIPGVQNQQGTTIRKKNKPNEGSLSLKSTKQSNHLNDKKVRVINNADIVRKAISDHSQNETASANNWPTGNANMSNAVSLEPRLNNASNNIRSKELYLKKSENSNADVAGRMNGINANDTIKDLNIVLKPLPMDSLKEVVIVGYGTQKKSTEKYPHVIIDTLEPAEGYVHFDDYVANNLKMPGEIKDKPGPGEVQLSFEVDKNGQPTNITVVKSLCGKCDEEAIRLLKEGPKWKKKKNKKGMITFRF